MINRLNQIAQDFHAASTNPDLSPTVQSTCAWIFEGVDLIASVLSFQKPVIVAVWEDRISEWRRSSATVSQ